MGALIDGGRYKQLVSELRLGKRLPEAVYLHRDALPFVDVALQALITDASRVVRGDDTWNVLKFATTSSRISFLSYPHFFDEGFPALASAIVVDLETGRCRALSYERNNPPILHRKETLLPTGHQARAAAEALTRAAEAAGLLDDSSQIGLREAWVARLARLKIRVVGHTLVEDDHAGADEQVHRHKTALTRYALSTPMQALWRHGYLDGAHSVFDYGCGRGDDLRALLGRGIDASGWDPYYASTQSKREADVVNLGFVLNVIEDSDERRDALLGAWTLARRVLVVGVLIGGRSVFERFRLFRDGVLTARGTFQKYFTPDEFRSYLDTHLGREPVALAPGIAFVFRDDADEQAFLARRASSRPAASPRPDVPRQPRPAASNQPRPRTPRAPSKWETYAELSDAFWERCLELGRLPEVDEFARAATLREHLGSFATVFRRLARERGTAPLDAAKARRRGDLLVFFALNLFERRRSYVALPEAVRRDTKAFLSSYQAAQLEAQQLLFSVGRVDVIHAACQESARAGVGFLDEDHSLQLHTSLARELPPVLRTYLGCSARLYGDVETADVVKLHIQSGKVSVLSYDDFEGSPVPGLIERVKINLRRQQIDFFEYGTPEQPSQPLYLKSRLIGRDFPHYDEQVAFDQALSNLEAFDLSGFGPSADEFSAGLSQRGLCVRGFELVEGPLP